ncbi:MAG: glycosyltransferase [Chloroflexi bacterium]|nr:glycosyltransferase [Chloroflexota bacterium]
MLTNRHYWWKAYRRVWEQLAREVSLESLLSRCIEVSHALPTDDGYHEAVVGQGGDRRLRILYVAPRYDYGNPARGLSYEENNFFHPLYSLGHEIIRFDFIEIAKRWGRDRMNQMLVEAAYRFKPQLVFTVLFSDEFDESTFPNVAESGAITTLNWFTDDHWRFDSFSRHWAPRFTWGVTTSRFALQNYVTHGIGNVILSQWACNQRLYYPMNLPKIYDVSFVGQPHGNRREVISRLRQAGINVQTWGYGWEKGKVTQYEMVRIFNQTKINLNLNNASVPGMDQIKGRNFEIPGCGGFMLTGRVQGLDEYYQADEEIVGFADTDDLIDKVRYYLGHEEDRERIALKGYRRTIRDHTYDQRFAELFSRVMSVQ